MPHVLVIDDDPSPAALVAGGADADWIVQAAPDGLVGLDRFRTHPTIDLIILDIEMPRFDGYQTATQLRAISPNVRIVPYTTTPTDAHLVGFMHELGCAPVVAKGTAPTVLYRQLRLALATLPPFQLSPIFVAYQRTGTRHESTARRSTTRVLMTVASGGAAVPAQCQRYA